MNELIPLAPCISERCIKVKINFASKGFMKAPKKSENKTFKLIFCLCPGSGREGLIGKK